MDYPTANQPTPLARREELVVQELPDEVLVYDLRQHKAHCLNKSAAFIWEQCDGFTSASELTRLAKEEFQVPIDEGMVWQTLERLSKAHLLSEPVRRPMGEMFRSRRAMLGKLSAAAMLSVPLVTTIVAPMATQAATIPEICTFCVTRPGGNNPLNCPSACDGTVSGACYANNSCPGSGNGLGCMSCETCRDLPGQPPARAWRAGPGTGC
jgi:Coenzyme PQQ synthesis protein D (PqqD)